MESKRYWVIFKTEQAESRLFENLSGGAQAWVSPIFELTRGRIRAKQGEVTEDRRRTVKGLFKPIEKWDKFSSNLDKYKQFVITVTAEPRHQCAELLELTSSDENYSNWCRFIQEQIANFPNLIPSLVINPSDSEDRQSYLHSVENQLLALAKLSSKVAYRIYLKYDDEYLFELQYLKTIILENYDDGRDFHIVLDHEYMQPHSGFTDAENTNRAIDAIRNVLPDCVIIIAATSYPKNINDIEDDLDGSFVSEEYTLFSELRKKGYEGIEYGDYASISPKLNYDASSGGSGWIPKIEYVTDEPRTFFFRRRREVVGYKTVDTDRGPVRRPIHGPYRPKYIEVAKIAVESTGFPKDLEPHSWGCKEILKAANGSPTGVAPNFWISVRGEIHILQMLRKLNLWGNRPF